MRGVLDVAMRRAKYWMLPPGDLHRRVFTDAHNGSPTSWATRSLQLLSRWGLDDFCVGHGSLAEYRRYVVAELEQAHASAWGVAARRHRVPAPYKRIMTGVSKDLSTALASNMPWSQLKKQLSFCRLRSGLVPLGHLSGRRSSARSQQCMSCDAMVSNLWVHVFSECVAWDHLRMLACCALVLPPSCRSWDVMYAILGVRSSSPAYSSCLDFVDEVVGASRSYEFRNSSVR